MTPAKGSREAFERLLKKVRQEHRSPSEGKAGDDKVERFLAALRATHPDMSFIFRAGGCYHLHVILRTVFADCELWYSKRESHVYTKIGSRWYDIRGGHDRKPKGAERVKNPKAFHRYADHWKAQMWGMLQTIVGSVDALSDTIGEILKGHGHGTGSRGRVRQGRR